MSRVMIVNLSSHAPLFLAPCPPQTKDMTIQRQILEVFNNCDNDTWMTCHDVWNDAETRAETSGWPIPKETSVGSKLNVGYKEKTLLKREITHAGRKKNVFGLLSKMTCEDCKKPQDDAAPDMMLRACDCCMAVWHPRCHKGKVKAAPSGDDWFCSDHCAEEMAQNQNGSHAEEEEEEEEEVEEERQRYTRKRKCAVPPGATSTPPQAPVPPPPAGNIKTKSTVVRSRALSLQGCLLSSACCMGSIRHPSASWAIHPERAVRLHKSLTLICPDDAGSVGDDSQVHETGGQQGFPLYRGDSEEGAE